MSFESELRENLRDVSKSKEDRNAEILLVGLRLWLNGSWKKIWTCLWEGLNLEYNLGRNYFPPDSGLTGGRVSQRVKHKLDIFNSDLC